MDRDDLLQPSLRGDVRMEALARLAARISALPVSTPLVNLFDLVDASALPALGEQFHILGVEGWNLAGTEAARRALLKRAIELHRHKGTPWAVRTALETALPTEASIKEWFAYGGDPFFFRVRLDVSELGLDETGIANAVQLIFDHKNVRSWLDCLETVTTRPLPVSIAVAGIMRTMNRVRLWFPPKPVPSGRVHVGLGSTRYSRSVIRPWTPPRPVPDLRGRIAFAIISQSRSIVCPKP